MILIANKIIKFFLSFAVIFLNINTVQAGNREILVGYGAGNEIEQNYRNQGIVISGTFYQFPKIDKTLIASLDATISNINSSTKTHDHLITAAIALAMRAYFANPDLYRIRPYIQASFGPSYLSAKQLGNRMQGSHFAFQTSMEAGTEFGCGKTSWDFNIRILHYCNAGIFHPNEGINLAPIISIGYIF